MSRKDMAQITIEVPKAVKTEIEAIAREQFRTPQEQAAFFVHAGLNSWTKADAELEAARYLAQTRETESAIEEGK